MNKILLFLSVFVFCTIGVQAQKYKDMMEDPSINFYEVVAEADRYFNTIDKSKKGSGYKPFMRWFHNNEYIYYPSGRRDNIDPHLAKKAYEEYLNKYPEQVSQSRSTTSGWRELGPNSIDEITGHYSAGIGRVEDAFIVKSNPQIIYLGSRSGGLWRTTDEGQTWTGGSTDFLPVSGVNTISGNPYNPDHILMNVRSARNGTSYGVYESIDGGATVTETNFNPINLGMGGLASNFIVDRVAYHPTNENLVFVGTNKGLYRSTDGMQTWTEVLTSGRYRYIYFHPTDPDIVYTINNNGGNVRDLLYKSQDGGVTFTTTEVVGNGENRCRISVSADEPNSIFWASSAGLWKSTDAGDSFTFQNDLPGVGNSSFVVSDTDASQMIMGYVDIYNSTDNGATFEQQTRWSLGSSSLHPSNNFTTNYETSTGYVHADINWSRNVNGTFYAMSDGTLAKSEDGGDNWTNLMRSGVGIRENYNLGISQSNNGLAVCGSQDNGSSIYKDTGWIEFYGADGMEGIIHPLNDKWIISSVQNGGRRLTKDGGYSQTSGSPSGSSAGAWQAPLAYDPNDHMAIYDFRDGVRKSYDFAGTHTYIGAPSFGTIKVAEVAQNDSNILVVASGSSLEKSTDGGATYTDIKGDLPNNTIQDIAFDPLDDDTILVVYASNNTNGKKVYVTFDGGVTWNNVTYNLYNMPVHSIVVDHSSEKNMYLGTEVGVFTKTMSADTWELYNPDLPSTAIEELEINWGANTIKAATWGRGLWEYDLVDRASYPSINYTTITDLPTEEYPKEGIAQFVTSEIAYGGDLSNVYVRWSIDSPDFSQEDQSITMSTTNGTTWISDAEIPNQPAGTKVYFKVFAVGQDNDISETYKFMYTVTPFEYCAAQGSAGTGSDYITSVTVGDTFVNDSGKDQYTFYDQLTPIELITGETYEVTVRLAAAFASDLAEAWIDFNNNATFDEDESFNMQGYVSNVATGSIVIPDTAVRGQNLRMRVRNSFYGDTVDSCGENAGEVEDYLVFIPFIAPTISCQDVTVMLNANGVGTLVLDEAISSSFAPEGQISLTSSRNEFTCDDLGTNQIQLTILDATGASASCTANVAIVDEIAPVVMTQDITVFLDENGLATITIDQIDNGSSDNCDTPSLSLDIENFTCENLGENNVSLTATDASSNSSSSVAVVTVLDEIAPVVMTQDVTVFLDENGIATVTIDQINNGSSDNCSAPSLSLDIQNFTCENLGENNVSLTATDASNNSSSSVAVVTVLDEIAPVVMTQDVTVFLDENGIATITIDQIDNGSSDNCDTPSLSVDVENFTCENLGENSVSLTATDASNNSSSAVSVVTVKDNLGPVLQCLEDTVVDADEDNFYTIPVYDIDAVDNCTAMADLQIVQEPAAGTVVEGPFEGTITISAVDQSDNESICTFNLQVNETLSTDSFELSDISLYPNPAHDVLTVSAGQVVIEKAIIYDIRGRKILEKTFSNTIYKLDVSTLSKAAYFLHLEAENMITIKRFIKN